MIDNSGSKAVMPQMVRMLAKTARQRIRPEGGDHRRVLARRVEVAAGEVRITGSKYRLLQTLVSKGGVNTVPIQGPSSRREGFEPPYLSNFSSHPGTTSIPPRVPGAFYRALEPIRRRQRRLSGFQGAQNRVSGWLIIQSSPSERRFLGPPRLNLVQPAAFWCGDSQGCIWGSKQG